MPSHPTGLEYRDPRLCNFTMSAPGLHSIASGVTRHQPEYMFGGTLTEPRRPR
jgi:hypothetical protein